MTRTRPGRARRRAAEPEPPAPPDIPGGAARAPEPEAAGAAPAAAADPWPEGEPDDGPDDDEPLVPRVRTVRELLALDAGQLELLVFRLGAERFAMEIASVEEVVEMEQVRPVPDAAPTLLGITDLRGRLVPVFSPARALRAAPGGVDVPVLLVMRDGERRVALAVDDVEDVHLLEPTALRTPALPDDGDDLVFGVVRSGDALVTVIDAATLRAACVAPMEDL